ncbi:AAA family ATPase [Scrofimicrobium sp. R131]|uniref:AAA family ATPase n=1 Tax=Scrofimicrobium appendicitidis TaxID=3079930 RepID=A0AAU7V7R6_9ACTO
MVKGKWDPPAGWQHTTGQVDPATLNPGDALGYVTGGVCDVVDIDPRNGGDVTTLLDKLPPVRRVVATPSGGLHLYIDALGLPKGQLAPGIDYQAKGAFVLMPPTEGYTELETVDVGAPAGDTWLRSCLERPEKERTESAGGLVTPQHRAKAEAILSKATRDIADRGEGSRNATVYAALVPLVSFVKAGAIAEDAVRAGLWDAVAAVPASEPYTRAEFEASWESAWAVAEARLPAVDAPADHFTVWTEPDPDPADALSREIERLRREDERKALTEEARRWLDNGGKPPAAPYAPLDLVRLMNPERPAREWVVEGLMFKGTATALVAPAGTGKSLIALRIALAVARGEADFAGMPIPKRRRVFYIDKENPEDEQHDRLKSFGLTQPDAEALAGWLYLVPFPNAAPLDTRHGGDQLMAALDAYDVGDGDVVFIDSFQRVTEGESNDDTSIRHYTQFTGDRLKAKGVAVVRLDNTGKDIRKGPRGSKGKSDDVDFEYQLSKVYESHGRTVVGTKVLKDRTGAVESVPDIAVTRQDGLTTFSQEEEQDRVQQCVAWLDTNDVPPEQGINKTWNWVRDNQPEPGYFKKEHHVEKAVKFRQQRGGDFDVE